MFVLYPSPAEKKNLKRNEKIIPASLLDYLFIFKFDEIELSLSS